MTIDVDDGWWKTLFDEVYLITDARSVCDESITRREINVITDMIPIRPEHRILDLCGGHGRHSIELCSRGFTECTLVDYSKALIDCAKKEAEQRRCQIDMIRSDARFASFTDGSFDHVLILGNSLGYIRLPEADHRILAEANRVLRPGGWLLVDVADGTTVREAFSARTWHEIDDETVVCRYRELKDDAIFAREMVLDKRRGLVRDRNYAVRLYDSQRISWLIESAGFSQITVHTDFSPHTEKGDYGFMNSRMIATARKTQVTVAD